MDKDKKSEGMNIYLPEEIWNNKDKDYSNETFLGWEGKRNQIFIIDTYCRSEKLKNILDSLSKFAKLDNVSWMKNGLGWFEDLKLKRYPTRHKDSNFIMYVLCFDLFLRKDRETGKDVRNITLFTYKNEHFDANSSCLLEDLKIGDDQLDGNKRSISLYNLETSNLNSDIGSCLILATSLKNYINKVVKDEGEEEGCITLRLLDKHIRKGDISFPLKYFWYLILINVTYYLSLFCHKLSNFFKFANNFLDFIQRQSKFVSTLQNKIKLLSQWHQSYQEMLEKTEITEYIIMKNNLMDLAVSFYIDNFLGLMIFFFFGKHFVEKLFYIRILLKTMYLEKLKGLFYYLTTRIFIYIKLNNEVASSLSKFVINKIIVWRYISGKLLFIKSFLLKMVKYSPIFGLSVQFALLYDILSLETIHMSYLYFIMLSIMNYCKRYLYSLVQLFKGKKWNILKSVLDTNQFTKEQLFIGVVFFIIFSLNYPTIWIFYISIVTIIMPVLFLKVLLLSNIEILSMFPYYLLTLNLFSTKFREGIYFKEVLDDSKESDKEGSFDCFHFQVNPTKISLSKRIKEIKKKLSENWNIISPVIILRKIIKCENLFYN